MGKQNVLKGDADMIAGIDEWLRGIEDAHQCSVRIVLTRSTVRRRLHIRVEACDTADGRLVGVRVRKCDTHPNGNNVDVVGAILKLMTQVDITLDEYSAFCKGVLPASGQSETHQEGVSSRTKVTPTDPSTD